MRAEDIVGLSFFATLFTGIGVAISASRKSLPSSRQALWRGCGLSLISLALIAFGVANFQFIHNSPRSVVEGNLWDIHQPFNRNKSATHFRVTDATGHAVVIRCRYNGPGLVEGERARIRYVTYNEKLLEMDMLSGPFQLWHLRESSEENAYWWWVGIGTVCAFFAFRQFANARQGANPVSRKE